jgi:flagellar biosynthesis/type III secretory pathway chaperone
MTEMADTLEQRLLDILKQEAGCAGELLDVLRGEQEALGNHDPEALEVVVAEKQALIGRLEALQTDRLALMEQGNYSRDSEGMAALVAAAPEKLAGDLTDVWQAFEEKLDLCQDQNQVNGQVLDATMRHTREALSLLLGGGMETELYNRDGAKTGPGGTRSYAKV